MSNSRSCISQNRPWSRAHSDASAALGASLWRASGKCAEDEPDAAPVPGFHLAEGGQHPAAERALELGELHDRDRRIRRPAARRARVVHRDSRRRQRDGGRGARAQLGQEAEAPLRPPVVPQAPRRLLAGLRRAPAFEGGRVGGDVGGNVPLPDRRGLRIHLRREQGLHGRPAARGLLAQQLARDELLEGLALQLVLPRLHLDGPVRGGGLELRGGDGMRADARDHVLGRRGRWGDEEGGEEGGDHASILALSRK